MEKSIPSFYMTRTEMRTVWLFEERSMPEARVLGNGEGWGRQYDRSIRMQLRVESPLHLFKDSTSLRKTHPNPVSSIQAVYGQWGY